MSGLKKWQAYALAGVVALTAVAGTAFAFRKDLILYFVATRARDATVVLANRDIPWQQGPEVAAEAAGKRPPNIVFILADDLGFNDISYFGGGAAGGIVQTPHIDSIARNGVNFSRGYAGTAACAPSRAMLMTGRYGTRTGFEFTPTPPGMKRIMDLFYNDGSRRHEMLFDEDAVKRQPPFAEQGLPGAEITLAEALKPRGYHNIHIGKWHLGNSEEFRPNAQGFDETVMMESGLFLPEDSPDVVNAKLPFDPIDQFLWARMRYATSYNGSEWFEPKGYLTDYYTDEAVKAIEANRNRPFFLYLAHWAVHTPLQASKEDYDALSMIEDERLRVYGAMIRALDRGVGSVLQALKDNGLDDNTLVIFTSDNGGAGYIGLRDINAPYRGWKLTFFEGGIRVPFFAQWPARIEAGASLDEAVAHIDMFPTVLAAAGAPLPDDRIIDGVDLLARLDAAAAPLDRPLFWRNAYYRVVQKDGWKLQVTTKPERTWLFNLNEDPTEQVNLAELHPERVAAMIEMLDAHDATQREPLFPAVGEMPVTIDKTLEEEATEDDEFIYWAG
ncbi:sulfatase-like hydrolase/transferase [Parvibaculum sp.]|uniref:sulfatase-like hydrolase/transferase n=1 Tax=Parvibaculum sp. TaxID=2024848 RepID=UPI001D7180C1|nr:sulfatase-like hydrolase/transferase [Parvibaculum sp.]MBX3489511.1 sulfatase-like hydrolase/transferase [Parvibaculum sp.]MCW5726533.1 sulfatase-like hydrolase/transferase [Parvibaculum sp.]